MAKEDIARKIYLEQQVDKKISKEQINKVYDEYKNLSNLKKKLKPNTFW
ncbi:MAG: hypothetical protein ACLU99_06130 [Alphaproteobacteria bacterium]